MTTFAITGVGGYIAPRHLEAIKAVDGKLVAAMDPHDSVGRLDQFGFDVKYFTDFERFERWLEMQRAAGTPIDYLVVCSPNYLHDCHVRLGMRTCKYVICEKPVVINPHNLDALVTHPDYKREHVSTIMQLRLNPKLDELKTLIQQRDYDPTLPELDVELTYITPRGEWYDHSWKGDEGKSGGLAMNIGVHLFDVMCWFFGKPLWVANHLKGPRRMSGAVRFEKAMVRWFLSVEPGDVDIAAQTMNATRACRRIVISEQRAVGKKRIPLGNVAECDFNEGFTGLHEASYRRILNGQGFTLESARAAIELVHQIRTEPLGSALWHHSMRHHFR